MSKWKMDKELKIDITGNTANVGTNKNQSMYL